MRNDFVLASKRELNPFTIALKARCLAEGPVLVKLRNGSYREVVYRPANPDAFEMDPSFHTVDHAFYWEPSGHSVTADRYDIVEFEERPARDVASEDAREKELSALLDLLELRMAMAAEGWLSEDRVLPPGWSEPAGYTIKFKRTDWHGRTTMGLTGIAATYQAYTPDLSKQYEAALAAAELARRAWREFPDCPPQQTAENQLEARKVVAC